MVTYGVIDITQQITISVKGWRHQRPRKDLILLFFLVYRQRRNKKINRKDLTGNKYGHLIVTQMLYNYNNTHKTKCLCNCDCGKKNILRIPYDLEHKSTKNTSCGCARADSIRESIGRDITNEKFGKLFVNKIIWEGYKHPMVDCNCDCGNKHILFRKSDVQSGHTQSCGCLQKERVSDSNCKDWTTFESDYGVTAIRPLYKNKKGQWVWEWKCPICGEPFEMLPAKIANNHTTSCGCRIRSNGEQLIKNILEELNIEYIPQYTFENCRDKGVLRFDFAVLKNGEVFCLFEYDGVQHFQLVDHWGGETGLLQRQKRDKIKDDYCAKNNIPLYRFKYDETITEIKEKITNIIYP